MPQQGLSLYLHIPFCAYRCSYCDFNTYTSLSDLQGAYVAALCHEIAQVAGQERRPVRTIFFGGGTPSLLKVAELAQIMESLHTHFAIAPSAEITMEMNPETVDRGYLTAVSSLGINRLSFGAQSAVESELALLGRQHSFGKVQDIVATAQAVGFQNSSIDLIYGVPGQTLASWETSLRAALALNTTHLSLYCLTIEPGTPMHRWLGNGQISPPDPDFAADQYILTRELLQQAGFAHYEISNWSRPGYSSEHNLAYWRNFAYLGLGAGAHGHAEGVRYSVVRQPRVYVRRLTEMGKRTAVYPLSSAVAETTPLTRQDQMNETMMMGLRLLQEGVSEAAFATQFGQTLDEVYGESLAKLGEWGLLQREHGRVTLTSDGIFVSNQVFHHFV
jgi:oxygen-independent coproporphyrinogen III oxidase